MLFQIESESILAQRHIILNRVRIQKDVLCSICNFCLRLQLKWDCVKCALQRVLGCVMSCSAYDNLTSPASLWNSSVPVWVHCRYWSVRQLPTCVRSMVLLWRSSLWIPCALNTYSVQVSVHQLPSLVHRFIIDWNAGCLYVHLLFFVFHRHFLPFFDTISFTSGRH